MNIGKWRLSEAQTLTDYSLVIRQKDESENGCFNVWLSGGKKPSLFGKFDVLCFLERLVLRFGFLPITDDLVLSILAYSTSSMIKNFQMLIFSWNIFPMIEALHS